MNPIARYLIAIAIAIAVVLGALWGAYLHGVSTTEDRLSAAHNSALAKAEAAARESERLAMNRINEIEAKHLEDNQRAQAAYDSLLDDYRSGVVRLRDRLSCPGVPGVASGSAGSKPAAGGGLQPEDVRFLVSEAKRADQVTRQLQACQAILEADRTLGTTPEQ